MGLSYQHGFVYWGRVLEQKFGANKQGNPQLNITFRILGQVDPNNPEGDLVKAPPFERTAFMTITEGTVDFVTEHIQRLSDAAGIETGLSSWAQLDPDSPRFTHSFVDAELGFYCKHDSYNGKATEKWSVAKAGGGKRPEVAAIDDKATRKLDALFGKQLKGVKPATKASESNGPPVATKEPPKGREPVYSEAEIDAAKAAQDGIPF